MSRIWNLLYVTDSISLLQFAVDYKHTSLRKMFVQMSSSLTLFLHPYLYVPLLECFLKHAKARVYSAKTFGQLITMFMLAALAFREDDRLKIELYASLLKLIVGVRDRLQKGDTKEFKLAETVQLVQALLSNSLIVDMVNAADFKEVDRGMSEERNMILDIVFSINELKE